MCELEIYQRLVGEKIIKTVGSLTEDDIIFLSIQLSNGELYLIRFGELKYSIGVPCYMRTIIDQELEEVSYNKTRNTYRFLTKQRETVEFVGKPLKD